MNFHLGLNLFTLPGAWCPTSGEPRQSPRLSLETSREKCATEWKSQHSQPSQIAIESIYSTLGKTRNQALIMRERVRETGRKRYFGNICREVQGESQLLFLFTPPVELAISSGLCASALWCSVSDLMNDRHGVECEGISEAGGLGEKRGVTVGLPEMCNYLPHRELNTERREKVRVASIEQLS